MAFKFAYVCDLFETLHHIHVLKAPLSRQDRIARRGDATKEWFAKHRDSIDDHDFDKVALLSCLLPEKRIDRKYHMGSLRLGTTLAAAQGLPAANVKRLREAENRADFTDTAFKIIDERCPIACSDVTIKEIDSTLVQLASISRASSSQVRRAKDLTRPLTQHDILKGLFARLSAREIKWLLRIILRDMGSAELFETLVLYCINPWLPAVARVRSNFQSALDALTDPSLHEYRRFNLQEIPQDLINGCLKPLVGIKVGRPRFEKMRSFQNMLHLLDNREWNIELKYDGEYCQVHIDLTAARNQIRLFSKSGKDSTNDRSELHSWLRRALRLDTSPSFKRQCILEGEMVCLDTRDNNKILPFHKIRKHVVRSKSRRGTAQDSEAHSWERLTVIFYDLLLVDDEAIMHLPHSIRRAKLREIVGTQTHTASWGSIDLSPGDLGRRRAQRNLERAFAKAWAQRCEGLVFKPANSPYLDLLPNGRDPWAGTVLKLKADYIPGLGDSADFAVVGAFRGDVTDIRAGDDSGNRWTHFVIACLANKEEVCRYTDRRPTYRLLDAISRPCISQNDASSINEAARYSATACDPEQPRSCYFDIIVDNPYARPAILFKNPLIVEVLGSGFDKASDTSSWMLRHARVSKIHADDRSYQDVISFDELQTVAGKAVFVPEDERGEMQMFMARVYDTMRSRRKPEYIIAPSQGSRKTEETPALTRMTFSPSSSRVVRAHTYAVIEIIPKQQLCADSQYSPTCTHLESGRRGPIIRVDSQEVEQVDYHVVATDSTSLRRRLSDGSPSLITPPRKRRTHSGDMGYAGVRLFRQPPSGQFESRSPSRVAQYQPLGIILNGAAPDRNTTLDRMQICPKSPVRPLKNSRSTVAPQMSPSPEALLASDNEDYQLLDTSVNKRPQLPRKLQHTSPFKHKACSVYVPAYLGCTLLTEYLLPLFVPSQHQLLDPHDWACRALPSSRFQDAVDLGPCADTEKVVFVDQRCHEETRSALDEIMRVPYSMGSLVQIWDFRVLQLLCDVDPRSYSSDDDHGLAHSLGNLLIGIVAAVTTPIDDLGLQETLKELFSGAQNHLFPPSLDMRPPIGAITVRRRQDHAAPSPLLASDQPRPANFELRGKALQDAYGLVLKKRWNG